MFETDNDLIAFALNSWANKIETGDSNLSKNDVIEMSPSFGSDNRMIIKMMKRLSDEQIELVSRIRNLEKKYANL